MTITAHKQDQKFTVALNWPDSEATLAHVITTDPLESLRALIVSGTTVELFVAVRSLAAKEQSNEPTPSGAR